MPTSDFYATEKIIGGLVVVGIAALVGWSISQGAEPGRLGIVFTAAMILGGLWVVIGLFELVVGHRWNGDQPRSTTTSGDSEQIAH